MKNKFFLIFFLILNCNWMNENQVQAFYGKKVYHRTSVIEKFQIAALTVKERCVNAESALNYMINEGFADEFTKTFYFQNSVDACILLFLTLDCLSTNDTSTNISYYKNFLYNCKLKSPN